MRLISLCLTALMLATPLASQAVKEKPLPLNGTWNDTGTVLSLDWQDAKPLRVGPVDINRRPLGATGGQSWEPLVENLQRRFFFEDITLQPGVAYEYQVIRKARDIVDVGYWLAGWQVPTTPERGVALLVIDESIAEPLAARIDRFERDLIGDGWRVTRHLVPRHAPKAREENLAAGRALRAWVTAEAESEPGTPHSLILLGNVPVMYSGRVAPDGHGRVPHATDLFYADIGRFWPEGEVGKLRPSSLPDLKIDMTVGRIDFQPVSNEDKDEELRQLARYLDRNHNWRHGRLGDLRNAYGQSNHLLVEQAALRNIVGADAIEAGGHFETNRKGPYLWGVDFFTGGEGKDVETGVTPVFAINFGSHKQKFTLPNAYMITLLVQDWYPLAVGWGGRPSWQLQHMALGGTIGDVHLRTVNNGPLDGGPYREVLDYFPMGQYLWRGPIWVNLMGDPTLHAFPLRPPQDLATSRESGDVTLTWRAPNDPDYLGAQVFRAAGPDAPFAPVSEVLTGTSFTDADAPDGAIYMLRGYGLRQVHAGSFYTYSQGAFAAPESSTPPLAAAPRSLTTGLGSPLRLPARAVPMWSFIEGPEAGRLVQDAEGWLYTPPEGFSGVVTLREAVSGPWRTIETTTQITVGD